MDRQTCVASSRNTELRICSSPVPEPAKRIVLVGDSHVGQWVAAMQPVAQRRNWQLIVITRGWCPFSTESEKEPGDRGCLKWNADAAAEILAMRPDAVFALATRDVRVGLTEQTPQGFVRRWRELDAAGIPVLAVRDNARFDGLPAECAVTKGADQCGVPRADLFAREPPYRHISDLPGNVSFLDFTDYYCTPDVCPPVLGNVFVYMDYNHTSATFHDHASPDRGAGGARRAGLVTAARAAATAAPALIGSTAAR